MLNSERQTGLMVSEAKPCISVGCSGVVLSQRFHDWQMPEADVVNDQS